VLEYASAIRARDLDPMQALSECIHDAGNEVPESDTPLAGRFVIGIDDRFLANLKQLRAEV
jgi:hypothetical protein